MFKSKESSISTKGKIAQDRHKYNNFQNKSKNNFREFQKVYGPIFNKQINNKEPLLGKTILSRNGFSSSTEIKMIRIEMPKLGSEHAILQPKSSKLLEKKINIGNNFTKKIIRPESNIKLLIQGANDTTRKLKQIQKMLQDRRNQMKIADSLNKLKQNSFQEEQIKRNYGSTLSLMQKKLQQVDSKYFTDTEIKTIFENTFVRQKESLQEIPEEDIEKLRSENQKDSEVYKGESKTIPPHLLIADKYFKMDDFSEQLEQVFTYSTEQLEQVFTYSTENVNDRKSSVIEQRKKKMYTKKIEVKRKAQTAEPQQRRKSYDAKTGREISFRLKTDVGKSRDFKSLKITGKLHSEGADKGKIITKKKNEKEKIIRSQNRINPKTTKDFLLQKPFPDSLVSPNFLIKKLCNPSVCISNRKL